MRGGPSVELAFLVLAAACFAVGFATPLWQRPAFEPGARPANALRVVTWNVGRGLNEGGSGLDSSDLGYVVEVLRGFDPDLCFLQELANRDQLQQLRAAFGDAWDVRGRRVRDGDYLAVVTQRGAVETFRVRAAGRHALGARFRPDGRDPLEHAHDDERSDRSNEARDAIEVVAVGLHADAFSAAERNKQIGSTVEVLHRRMHDVPHILAGDLNLDLDLDKRRDLFTDNEYLDVETYNYVADRLVDVARGRGSTAEPDRRLDYIFVSSKHFSILDAGPAHGRRRGAMDHDPVVADLKLR